MNWAKAQRRRFLRARYVGTMARRLGLYGLPPRDSLSRDPSLTLLGFPEYQLSIGGTLRDTVHILEALGRPPAIRPFYLPENKDHLSPDQSAPFRRYFTAQPRGTTSWCFLDAHHLTLAREALPGFFKNRRTMATLWWEYESGSETHYQPVVAGLDHVICHTRFVRDVFAKYVPAGRLIYVPYPFAGHQPSGPREALRRERKISGETYLIIYSFDYRSGFMRKNPQATLRVFSKLHQKYPQARLLLKTAHGFLFPRERDLLHGWVNESGCAEAITVLDCSLDRQVWTDWLASADLYLSLHRGEGLGLGLLESMWLGVPVAATHYGGNTDFMAEGHSVTIPYIMAPCRDPYFPPYREVTHWAEPDEAYALERVSELMAHPSLGAKLGKQGMGHVHQQFSPQRLQDQYAASLPF